MSAAAQRGQKHLAVVVNPDEMLEELIAHAGEVLVKTQDRRYVEVQRMLIGMRSPAQVERMERALRASGDAQG